MSTRVFVIFFALLFAVPVWAQSKSQNVTVTNFPATQTVSGQVEVSNLPAVQNVNVVGGCNSGSSANAQLLGFTQAEVSGSAGFFALIQACGAEFPGSHVCRSDEIIGSTQAPAGLSGSAWVVPTFQLAATLASDASGTVADFTERFTCGGWSGRPAPSYSSAWGLGVDSAGAFSLVYCGTAHHVACCGVPQ